MKNIFICFLLSVIILDAFAQKISSTSFNETVLAENFNVEGSYFPIMVNEDNYFVLDKGDYLLSRNNQQTEYAIIAKTKTLTDFILKTKIKIAPSKNKLSSIGVLFKTQLNATGAIIVEINGDGEYRIKQLIDSTYKIISNKEGANGWKYNKVINKEDSYNILEVRCNDNIYELYINNMYLDSFFIAEYNNGLCGLIINPETKARIAYYYIKAKGGDIQSKEILTQAYQDNQKLNETKYKTPNTDLNKIIITLRQEIKDKEKQIGDLEKKLEIATQTIKELKNDNIILEAKNQEVILEDKNSELEQELTTLKSTIKELTKENLALQEKNQSIEKEKKKLKTRINASRSFTDNIQNLEIELENKNKTISKNKTIIQNVANQLKQKKEEFSSLKSQNNANESHIKTLELKNNKLTKKNASLLANLETAKGKLIDAENTNQDLKDLFVSKDFKLNGLKLSNIESAKSTYPNPKNIDDSEYIYTIQIAAYSNKINVSSFKQVQNVKCNQLKNGIFIYISGEFNSVIEAAKHQNKLKKNGYRNAFIIKIKK